MRLIPVLAAAALCIPLSQGLAAQKKRAGQKTDKVIAALEEVQAALHAAERAQIKLLRAGGAKSPAFVHMNRAVQNLNAARDVLRAKLGLQVARLAGPEAFAKEKKPLPRLELPKPDRNKVRVAIERGLKWLQAHQDRNGRWDSDEFVKHDTKPSGDPGNPVHDVGVTGLALLAFLGDGNTTQSGPYKDVVLKAVRWLQKQQGANGLFGTAASHDFIYDHSIAAFAMCEAFGLSKDDRLKKSAQSGINYLESHRNPYACWRYQPRDNDNDSSVTSWCIKAYRSAQDHGLEVNKQALKIAENFIDELTDPKSGRVGYTKRGERSSRHPGDHSQRFPIEKTEALTAAGLSSRFILGQKPSRSAVMKLSAQRLVETPPTAEDRRAIDHYYWYHGTSAMQQMGGKYWDRWSRSVTRAILSTQRPSGSAAGSWDSSGAWGEDGGRIYATSLLLNCLQVTWRDLKLRDR